MDVVDILYAKNKFGGGSSGGNPNRVQVIEGTLAQPFGDVAYLAGELLDGNANAKIEATLGELTVEMPVTVIMLSGMIYIVAMYSQVDVSSISYSTCATAAWDGYSTIPNLTTATLLMGGDIVNLYDMAPQIPTTLTIYWHPMPSNIVGQAKVGQAQV